MYEGSAKKPTSKNSSIAKNEYHIWGVSYQKSEQNQFHPIQNNDPVLISPASLSVAMITPLGEVFSPTSASMRQSVQRMGGHMI